MPSNDKVLPENAKGNLDRRLDHAVEETFPTSDPVSVTITKGGAIDGAVPVRPAERSGDRAGSSGSYLDQAQAGLNEAGDRAWKAGRSAYDQGQRFAAQALDRWPQAERQLRESTSTLRTYASAYPLVTLAAGATLGFVLAKLMAGGRQSESVPDYARTRRTYSPYKAHRAPDAGRW
jgi:hypothetical protein